jgi:hypothetical protein
VTRLMCARLVNVVILLRCRRAATRLAQATPRALPAALHAWTRRPGCRPEALAGARATVRPGNHQRCPRVFGHRGQRRSARVPGSDASRPCSRAMRLVVGGQCVDRGHVAASSPTASVMCRTRTVDRTRQPSRWAAVPQPRETCAEARSSVFPAACALASGARPRSRVSVTGGSSVIRGRAVARCARLWCGRLVLVQNRRTLDGLGRCFQR